MLLLLSLALFCRSGGLLRLQRLYTNSSGQQQLGNDWAAAAAEHIAEPPPVGSTRIDAAAATRGSDASKSSDSSSNSNSSGLSGLGIVVHWLQWARRRCSSLLGSATAAAAAAWPNRQQQEPSGASEHAAATFLRKLLILVPMQQQRQEGPAGSSKGTDLGLSLQRHPLLQETEQASPRGTTGPSQSVWAYTSRSRSRATASIPSSRAFGELQYNVYNLGITTSSGTTTRTCTQVLTWLLTWPICADLADGSGTPAAATHQPGQQAHQGLYCLSDAWDVPWSYVFSAHAGSNCMSLTVDDCVLQCGWGTLASGTCPPAATCPQWER